MGIFYKSHAPFNKTSAQNTIIQQLVPTQQFDWTRGIPVLSANIGPVPISALHPKVFLEVRTCMTLRKCALRGNCARV